MGLERLEICDDGIGDIPGILEKLDYLESDLGIKIIWLSCGFKIFKHDFILFNMPNIIEPSSKPGVSVTDARLWVRRFRFSSYRSCFWDNGRF